MERMPAATSAGSPKAAATRASVALSADAVAHGGPTDIAAPVDEDEDESRFERENWEER